MKTKKDIERLLVKNLLKLTSCFVKKGDPFTYHKNKKYFWGVKKGNAFFDLERALDSFFRASRLIRILKIKRIKILFIGCPTILEKKISLLMKNKHFFISSTKWKLGGLGHYTAILEKPHLIVVFRRDIFFMGKESFALTIPTIAFMDNKTTSVFIDFPVFLNLTFKKTICLFLYLINQSL